MNCPEQSPGACDGAPCRAQGQKRRCMSAVEQGSCPDGDPAADWEVEEEEDEDRFLGVLLRRSCALRASFRERDSYRRHSWEPGKKLQSAPDYDQMSVSLKGLAPEELDSAAGQLDSFSQHRRDPRRAPIIRSNDELESLLLQDEEEDLERAQEDARRLQAYRTGQNPASSTLSKCLSLSGIDRFPDADEIPLFASGTDLTNGFNAGSCGQLDAAGEARDQESQRQEGSPLGRTLSFFMKMTGKSKGLNLNLDPDVGEIWKSQSKLADVWRIRL
nr:A-kinase anchor protein 13-like [Caretta caretta]